MAKVELIIANPKKIDAGEKESATLWTYAGTDHPLVLDTDDCSIECEVLNKKSTISNWVVDAENHIMKLSDDVTEGKFDEITQAFAASIGGQLVATIGIPTLRKYLDTIGCIFSSTKPKEENENATSNQDQGGEINNESPNSDETTQQ